MGLFDHFRPPLSLRRHWHSFHNSWASNISAELNRVLPEGYFSEANVQFGIEIDVAVQDDQPAVARTGAWQPQAPTLTIPFQPMTDAIEINVFSTREGPILAGAVPSELRSALIELVSPANKDRPSHKNAFTAKCETYLNQGVGLVIVDVVTILNANLHCELMQRMNLSAESEMASLYATAYQVAEYMDNPALSVWQESLQIGERLPTLPLWLKGGLCVPIDLNQTYDRTCLETRISESTQNR